MSQDIWDTIVPSSTSGNQLATYLNDFKDAVVSGFSGTSRPSELQEHGYWVDTTDQVGLGLVYFMFYDGTQDILVFTINMSTGSLVVPESESLMRIVQNSDDAVGPTLEFFKRRASGNGQAQSGDVAGNLDFNARSTDSELTIAQIQGIAAEAITNTQQGSYLVFKVSNIASGAMSEAMRLLNSNLGMGVTLPTEKIHIEGNVRSEKTSADAVGPKHYLKKKRIATNGQVLNNDLVGTLSFLSTDQLGADVEVAQIEVKASEDTTTTGQGTTLTIRTKPIGSTTFRDSIVIKNGDLENGGTETQFTIANNQVAFADVTGLLFDSAINNGGVFEFIIERDTSTEYFIESGTIRVTRDTDASDWLLSLESSHDDAGVTLDITATGQVQFKSTNMGGTGYVGTLTIKNLVKFAT